MPRHTEEEIAFLTDVEGADEAEKQLVGSWLRGDITMEQMIEAAKPAYTITAAQYRRMHNIGIQPLPSDAVMSTFGRACYTDSPADLLIDATSSPADAETCENWSITPSQFHAGVIEALGRFMTEYKSPRASVAETAVVMRLAGDIERPFIAEWLKGEMSLDEVVRRTDEAKAIA